jgi:ADP-heptose:LPS heptosyltransferase
MELLLMRHKNLVVITVADELAQLFEVGLEHERVIHKSGKWSLRETAIACKYASLVISPETGVLHMAGCFDTPKLGFITHTTKECVTKYFKNDYSLEAKVDCAPCFRLIDDYYTDTQCPVDKISHAPWCAGFGFPPNDVIKQVEKVYYQ